jgi:hypothetical protein
MVVLSEDSNNFFVLASEIPFRVSSAEPNNRWLAVEALAGKQTAHRVVAVKRRAIRLKPQPTSAPFAWIWPRRSTATIF